MNIQEMHNTFRTLGQQMGMQLVRGILPESIDVYINDVIVEKTQQELLGGVRTALQDSINTQASTMSTINAFRSLYRTARYSIDVFDTEDHKVHFYNDKNGFHIINIPTINADVVLNSDEYKIDPMMYLGFSVEYRNTIRGNAVACRLIGADVLETTLRDYCNGASKDSPIVVLNSATVTYLDPEDFEQLEIYTGTKDCNIEYLNIKYIKVPNVVKFDMDITKCVNCDLPAYTHFDIVERAVDKFRASIGGGNFNQIPQQQRQ